MKCIICLEEVELFHGGVCVACMPAWWDKNRSFLFSFGCVIDGCATKTQNSLGMCSTHCDAYWGKGGKSPKARGKWFEPDGSRKKCILGDCERVVKSRGLCRYHYMNDVYETGRGSNVKKKYTRRRDLDGNRLFFPCAFEGCEKPYFNRELCAGHYYQVLRGEELRPLFEKTKCAVWGCEIQVSAKLNATGICANHRGLATRFSLTDQQLLDLHVAENLKCKNTGCGSRESLQLDHDHSCCPRTAGVSRSCGKCVRGWLCRSCNLALGLLQENPRKIQGLLELVNGFKK